MFKKLSQASGSLENKSNESDSAEKLVRPAILVHAGDFMSGDGAIGFDEKRIKNLVENHNTKINALAEGYGGLDKMPIGAFPPILDQHENDSNDRIIGRLASLLRFEVRDVPGVGKDIPCACADITFLGEDSCKRVLDGRIYHLSIGIDESTDTLGETSAVIEPAAPGAMLLKKKKGGDMPVNRKRLESHKTRLAKLSSIQESVTTLSKKLDGVSAKVSLTKAQGSVTTRLSALVKSGKLTPAEFKKLDIKKLAALPAEACETLMASYEALEPKVDPKQHGSADGVAASELRKNLEKKQIKNLKAEIKKDMKRMGAKVDDEDVDMADEKHEKKMAGEKDPHAVDGSGGDEKQMSSKHLAEMKKHLEGGDVDMAKSCLAEMEEYSKKMSDGFAQEGTEHVGKSMEELSGEVDEIKTQLARLAGLMSELAKSEEDEGKEAEKEMSDEESDEEKKKKLAEEIKGKNKNGEQA